TARAEAAMIVQIYAATSVADALRMVDLGVDQVGFVAGAYGEVHAELTFAQSRRITDALRGKTISSALTMSTDTAEILRMAEAVQPDIVHISSDTDAVGVEAMAHLRQQLPKHVQLMKAIDVDDDTSVAVARRFAEVSDILLLDTKVKGMPGVGATGVTHDWAVSGQIVKQTAGQCKVILAGGLTPENVAEAIAMARPWGVDSNTGTNLPGDPVAKDMARVKAFVDQAKGTV
ncbi:MAG: phosphoribosylanthranilate isomerase, partial [Anaerolineae bacterium]|nr:phosphoribosylanthranilate isomerase [Anaerolineae bacterium]